MAVIDNMTSEQQELHRVAMERYHEAVDTERSERELCVEDIKFSEVAGGQWEDRVIKQRGARPRLEINKVALPVNIYLGNFRQSDITVTYRPASGGATRETADVFKGITRHILERSSWEAIATNASKEQATGGIGAFAVKTQFSSDDTFGQEIRVRMIRSAATSVFYDPSARLENKQDMKYAFVTEFLGRKTFEKRYPKATESEIPDPTLGKGWNQNWFEPDRVRISEYWMRESVDQTLLLMSDGSTLVEEEAEDVLDDLAAQEPPILQVDSRKVRRHKVVRYLMNGAQLLEGPDEWLGQTIPVIPVFGYNIWVDGTHYYRGIIRPSKDAQRAYNYLSSERVERTALAPQDAIWMTQEQGRGHDYSRMNVENKPVRFYNIDDKAPGPPARLGAAAPLVEMASQLAQADQDIQATTGKFAAALGSDEGSPSGVAVDRLERSGQQATFQLTNNFASGMEVMGGIFSEIIPKIFTEPQIVRILGDDAQEDFVPINQEVEDEATGEMVILNDMAAGKYDHKVDIGPSFVTKRTEGFEALSAIARDNEALAPLMLDLIADNMDFPFADELKRRVRRPLLQQGIVQPNEEERAEIEAAAKEQEGQQQQPDFNQFLEAATLDRLQAEKNLADAKTEGERADALKTLAETRETIADTINTRMDTLADAQRAGIPPPITADELRAELVSSRLLADEIEEQQEERQLQEQQEQQQELAGGLGQVPGDQLAGPPVQ